MQIRRNSNLPLCLTNINWQRPLLVTHHCDQFAQLKIRGTHVDSKHAFTTLTTFHSKSALDTCTSLWSAEPLSRVAEPESTRSRSSFAVRFREDFSHLAVPLLKDKRHSVYKRPCTNAIAYPCKLTSNCKCNRNLNPVRTKRFKISSSRRSLTWTRRYCGENWRCEQKCRKFRWDVRNSTVPTNLKTSREKTRETRFLFLQLSDSRNTRQNTDPNIRPFMVHAKPRHNSRFTSEKSQLIIINLLESFWLTNLPVFRIK